jgi:alanyl-tRNA synthetase
MINSEKSLRPYYTDPYTVSFESETLEIFPFDEKTGVVLEKSYFYPTSGGQEHDTGTINGVNVLDVVERDDKITHVLSGAIDAGKAVCKIDWERRFENMQQHTGQHILSAVFESLFDYQTVSSRLGEDIGTIDLSRQPSDEELQAAVAAANRVVQENRDVIVHFADDASVGNFKLRKAPKVVGTIRIVEVKDLDFSPCGGTHCTHTSEVGVILTGHAEKVKSSQTRIEFACGNRAIRQYYALHKSAAEAGRLLSTVAEQLPAAVMKLKSQSQENGAKLKEMSERILGAVCEKFAQQLGKSSDVVPAFDLTTEVSSAEELRYVASSISRRVNKSFVVSRTEQNVCQMYLALFTADADSKVNQLREEFSARGGGRSGFYSLNFEVKHLADVIDKLKRDIENG